MRSNTSRLVIAAMSGAMVSSGGLLSSTVWAGVPECNNLRLEGVGACEIRGELDCAASCEDIGVYKKACATKLQTVCSRTCTLEGDATCTDDCTESCAKACDRGENVICIHNCFGECTGGCDLECEGDVDPERCRASCEANCDAECDISCKPLVDGDCYEHCTECCHGSCTAQANLSCQNVCQEKEFEECEYEFRADCDASCSGEGALFCDDEYVVSGKELPDCAGALVTLGLASVDGWAEAEVDLGAGEVEIDLGAGLGTKSGENNDSSSGSSSSRPGCSVAPRSSRDVVFAAGLFGLMALAAFARRRDRA